MAGQERAAPGYQYTRGKRDRHDPMALLHKEIEQISFLSDSEIRSIFEQRDAARLSGDAAKEQQMEKEMTERFLPYVQQISKLFSSVGIPQEELINEGSIGLMRAVKKYDIHHGTKFVTFSWWYIFGKMMHFVQRQRGGDIHVPLQIRGLTDQLTELKRELTQQLGHPPTTTDIAQHVDMTEDQVEAMMHLPTTYQPTTANIDAAGRTLPQRERAVDVHTPEEIISQRQLQQILKDALRKVPERSRRVLELRYPVEGDSLTQEEVGKMFTPPLTESQVKGMEKKAIAQLRRILMDAHPTLVDATIQALMQEPAAQERIPLPKITIEPGTVEDCARVSAENDPAHLREYLKDKIDVRILMLKIGAEPVGFLMGHQDEQDQKAFYISLGGVVDAYRRKGIRTALHQELLKQLEKTDYTRITGKTGENGE